MVMYAANAGIVSEVERLTAPVADLFPEYHVDAADINEALDHGVASCAVRAYACGLILERALPSSLYTTEFGFASGHGGEFQGENGVYLGMGHAFLQVVVPEFKPVFVDSFTDQTIQTTLLPPDEYDDFMWYPVQEGYERYLEIADIDTEINTTDILYIMALRSPQIAKTLRANSVDR